MTYEPKPLWIARVAGSQEEMGRQHGALLAAAGGADHVVAHYRDMPMRLLAGGGSPPVRAALRGVSEALLWRLAAARPAEMKARSRGFFDGLGRPRSWARYLGVMDLFQNYVGVAARWEVGPFARRAQTLKRAAMMPACSTVMAWDDVTKGGALAHARNFDFPGIGVWDAAPAVVLCAPDRGQRYGFVTIRGGDAPVVTVWNQAGITITSHTRFHRAVRFDAASIVDLVHDIARRAETLADAAAIARERPVASSWGLAVSSARERRGVALEIHGGGVAVVSPAGADDHLVVCNRYRDPAMQDGEVTASPAWPLHSDRRERRLHQRVAEVRARGGAAPLDLAAMLVDREDPDAPGVIRHLGAIVAQPSQVQSVVVVPDQRAIWLGSAAAPVGEGRWRRVAWDWDGTPGAWQLGDAKPDGFGVTVDDAGALPRSPAADAVGEAIAIEHTANDPAAIAAALDRAIAAAPGDPSLRQARMWTAMRLGEWPAAIENAEAGLARESLPYRRGQLLLWGARAAMAAGDAARAATWRDELGHLHGAGVAFLQAHGRRDATRPRSDFTRRPSPNLSLLDAR